MALTPERWEKIRDTLDAALALAADTRSSYLDEACAGDPDLRAEVESLIDSHEQAGSGFLNEGWGAALDRRPADAGPDFRPGHRIGPYQIRAWIGRGGMGEVFAASRADGQYEQDVALKVVRAGFASAAVVERFRAERQILAGLDHPNIARLLDGGATEDGAPYLAMELIDGVPIDEYCRRQALSVADRLRLMLLVCSAVQYAHQRLVIHRDIKPGNILVTGGGVPKLLDFGIARVLDPLGTAQETTLRPFTPEYASPEQVRGEVVSTTSDVYSLAVVLFQLLTGRSPYRLETREPGQLTEAITSRAPERPSALHPQLRGDLDVILLKALRKEPDKRYGSVEQFADDLRRHLNGLPVTARKGTWTYLGSRFVRRHRTSVAAAVLVLVTLVAGIVVTAREARIAEANRRRADARFDDVRRLANSLIFEVHDAIANLPGATDARTLILERSIQYLDSLAKESANEPVLMRELAAAYDRIAGLQGNPFSVNVGDTPGARASFQKALALRESLARANPSNHDDQVNLAATYSRYADFLSGAVGDVGSGIEYDRRAIAILDREADRAPGDAAALSLRLEILMGIGMIESGNGLMGRLGTLRQAVTDMERALALTRQAIARAPTDAGLRFREASIHLVIGQTLQYLGEREAALNYMRQGVALFDPLVRQGTDARAAFNRLVSLGKIGDTLLIDGRVAEAIPYYRDHLDTASRMLAADPHNASLRREQSVATVQLGHALVEVGRVDEGVPLIRMAVAGVDAERDDTPLSRSVEGLIRGWYGEALERQGRVHDASRQYATARKRLGELHVRGNADPRILGYYAAATDRLAATLVALGQSEEAQREYEEVRTLLEPLVRARPEEYEIAYVLAETYTAEGALAAARGERARSEAERRTALTDAAASFRKSLDVWSRVPNPARTSTSGFEVTVPADVSKALARIEHKRASPGRALVARTAK